ncbi:PepSY domain-containing protein [Saliterribacillus persicus]|uniref:Peptidase YpeB-like protein n=1 Tax=Saliterribacillus persicus TaxID=930114 RepID=A0A368YAB4_9BACI|nr:PepSY domain-containing protein [Saliterribacillus persicus]RCW77193.1 peptidase YpeB-like protein [Saliterribacillus persicus]
MKNKKFITIMGIILLIGGILAIFQLSSNSASAYLSEKEAKTKAQEQFAGDVVEIELDEENNRKVYEIEIHGETHEYELKLDAESGEILKLEEKPHTNTVKEKNSKTTEKPTSSSETNEANKPSTEKRDDTDDQGKTIDINTLISKEKAKEIALKEADGTITDIELDEDDGRMLYEIEMDTDTNEVDIEIDAYTGEILSISMDDLDD